MSVNTKLTAIADEVRELSGATGKLGLDAMATNLGDANTEVATQTELISQINIVLDGKVTGSGIELPTLTNEGTASDLLSNKQLIDGEGNIVTGTIPSQSAKTITPSIYQQTAISAGTYASGAVMVKGDSNLLATNIKNGVSIFNVLGTYEGDTSNTGNTGNIYTTEVTLASDYSTQSFKSIATIPFLRDNYNNDKLFVMLMRKATDEMTYSIPIVFGSNTPWLVSSYALAIKRTSYGMSVSYKPNADTNYKLSTDSLSNTSDISRIRIYADGSVKIYPEKSYSFVAGTYTVIYGLL